MDKEKDKIKAKGKDKDKEKDKEKDKKSDKKKSSNKQYNYFSSFVDAAKLACDAAKLLNETILDLKSLEKNTAKIHTLENDADVVFHETMTALNKAFITPIEREDIRLLSSSIDDVVDSIDDITMDLHIYDITVIFPEAIEFAELILKSCETLKKTLQEFKDYKKSKNINQYIIEINDNEEAGDKLYQKAIRKLFTAKTYDTLTIIKWKQIYEVMEYCCDSCETVADVIEGVILKNS